MTQNPYQSPASSETGEAKKSNEGLQIVKMYSPTQVACGTLGGPVGLIYFLKKNFDALGKIEYSRNTIYLGVFLIIAISVSIPFLPEKFPSSVFAVVYIVLARSIATKYQLTKDQIAMSSKYQFHSNWRVFGLSLVCLLASIIIISIPVFVFLWLGLIQA